MDAIILYTVQSLSLSLSLSLSCTQTHTHTLQYMKVEREFMTKKGRYKMVVIRWANEMKLWSKLCVCVCVCVCVCARMHEIVKGHKKLKTINFKIVLWLCKRIFT
jgi:hypothetical protein